MIKAIFFDLDGTLLPMDENEFTNLYFSLMCKYVASYGYEKNLLIKTIWNGTKKMFLNDGSKTNEEVFWDYFKTVYGEEKINDKEIFNLFYISEFKKTKSVCKDNFKARLLVKAARENFNYVILATNPIFPAYGTKTRMNFVCLNENDFDFVTTYENSSYCKTNPNYYLELLKKFNLKADEVIMFGNNVKEDGEIASRAGIKTFLIGDYIIDEENKKEQYPHLDFDEAIDLLNNKGTEE